MSSECNVVSIASDEQFSSLTSSATPTITIFFASWAPECADMNSVSCTHFGAPISLPANAGLFLTSCQTSSQTPFFKVGAEEFADTSERLEIVAVPTFLILRDSKIIERIEGPMHPSSTIEKYAKQPASYKLTESSPAAATFAEMTMDHGAGSLNGSFSGRINKAPMMLFMKGNPNQPRCGFSRRIVQILKDHSIALETFDILEDDEVRQGLKEFSNWATYPQLYAKGELMGGLDIVKEMV
ncbi:thioredoxin-like protein, partial [Chytriomyces sp. MP71]